MLSDDELDDYVASLLTNRAQRQSADYSTLGFRAFLKDAGKDGPVGKPNTRFLKNIVRDVDGYNAALARKEEKESRERLRELRKRDGDKLYGYKEESSRGEEDWRARRESNRSRSRSPHRLRGRDSDERDRRRTSRRDDSREDERKEHHHGESRRKRRSRHEESEDEEDRSRQRRKHRHRQRDSDDEGRRRRRHRDPDNHRHSKEEGDRNHRRSDDIKEKQYEESTRKPRHSSSKRDLSPRHRSRRIHRHHNSSDPSSEEDSKHKHPSDKRRRPSDSDSDSAIGPGSPVHGPEYRIAKGRGKMNGGNLDAKFSDTYDPRKDTPGEKPDSDNDTDDWGVALRALRERQSFILSGAMTERLTETQNESQSSGWPTYSKGEREWDKGKVVLDDGSVGVKVWGVEKPL